MDVWSHEEKKEYVRGNVKVTPVTKKFTAKKLKWYEPKKKKKKKKSMVLYSAVSSPLDRSKRFTLSSPGRPVHSDTVLGFSWKNVRCTSTRKETERKTDNQMERLV